MFVESFKCADEDAAVQQDAPHPEVDVLQHLTTLPHRLKTSQTNVAVMSPPCSDTKTFSEADCGST